MDEPACNTSTTAIRIRMRKTTERRERKTERRRGYKKVDFCRRTSQHLKLCALVRVKEVWTIVICGNYGKNTRNFVTNTREIP